MAATRGSSPRLLSQEHSTQINWILEFVSDIGFQDAMKALTNQIPPNSNNELLRHRMNLGALKSIATNHATFDEPWCTVVDMLQAIGSSVSRRERREYTKQLQTAKAYAAVQELDETQDDTKYAEAINEVFHDEDSAAERDLFLGLLLNESPRYHKPEKEWWTSLLHLITTLENILPQTYLSKFYQQYKHERQALQQQGVKRAVPADVSTDDGDAKQRRVAEPKEEAQRFSGVIISAHDLRELHPCSDDEWMKIFEQVHPDVEAFLKGGSVEHGPVAL